MTHAKDQIHTEVYFWDVFNPFGHARPHPLEILEQICNISMDPWSHVKKTFSSSTHSRDEADSLFGINLGMPRNVWLHSLEMTE